jgi:hypothetical protein
LAIAFQMVMFVSRVLAIVLMAIGLGLGKGLELGFGLGLVRVCVGTLASLSTRPPYI